MANLRDIRRRIRSVKNIGQITKAMQMVAATKMRRAQNAAFAVRPYASKLDDLAAHLFASIGPQEIAHPLLRERQTSGKVCALVITTEKGLCGPLNTNLLRDVLKADNPNKVYVSAGRKGRIALARLKKNLLADFELKDTVTFAESKAISRFLLDKFAEGAFDRVEIFYNRFVNVLSQTPTRTDLVPIGAGALQVARALGEAEGAEAAQSGTPNAQSKVIYNFEPEVEDLLGRLLPAYVHLEVYQKILEARASEHSARMVAMKNATDNSKALVKDLTLDYNKARQASITNEILEIASAAGAMA